MKCPKCGYLGFEQVDRCRNCGYEFSLVKDVVLPELPLNQRRAEGVQALDELSFLKESPPAPDRRSTSSDLPLFEAPVDDTPLITKASPPRSPLAVRRATPEVPRLRPEPRAQSFDLGFDPETAAGPHAASAHSSEDLAARSGLRYFEQRHSRGGASAPVEPDAGLIARFLAVAADVIILGIIDVIVIYFTLQICGLSLLELPLLPKGPMLAFLTVQNGGYLVAFTASGQTLGKMAAGIRVVTAEAEPLSVGRAALRTLMWALLALPAGLGFLTAFFRSDRRGLHDRLAGTRVVRASA